MVPNPNVTIDGVATGGATALGNIGATAPPVATPSIVTLGLGTITPGFCVVGVAPLELEAAAVGAAGVKLRVNPLSVRSLI